MNFEVPPDGEFNGKPWWLELGRDPGHNCGECGRLLKVYQRRLSRAMTRSLIRLYRLTLAKPENHYFHVKQFDREGARGEFGVLSSWGFVLEQDNHDADKRSSGMWEITNAGVRFVKLEFQVPQHVILKWGSEHIGFSGPMVSAKDCLEHGNKFSYQELMEWIPDEVSW
jgi:hypothetical protein